MAEELQRCTYVLPTKKRKCRMLVKKGKRFCGEHAIFDPDQTERIPCPNDPKHTVNRSELEEHLAKRCNSRLFAEPWIVQNLNFIESPDGCEEREYGRPSEMQLSRISILIQRVSEKLSSHIVERISQTSLIEQYLQSNGELGETHRKHLIQQSSIIGHLEEANLLKNDPACCFIDLGAGRAQLTYWMARTSPKSRFLLIDRTGCRNKHDNKALQEDPSLRIHRLRCSIEHLDLSKVDCVKDAEGAVAVCKHFCGTATDCGIRCLTNAMQRGVHIRGFALAPCCHHKSTFTQYTGKDFLAKYGICGEEDFNVLRYFATWAVCGMRVGELAQKESNVSAMILNECDATVSSVEKGNGPVSIAPVPPTWTREQKENLGRQAKALLEMGRAEYLQSFGYRVGVYKYADSRLSPENLLIVGTERE